MSFPVRRVLRLAACALVVNMLSIASAHAMEPAGRFNESCSAAQEIQRTASEWSDAVDCLAANVAGAAVWLDDPMNALDSYLMLTDVLDQPLTAIGGMPESESLIAFTLNVTATNALVGNALSSSSARHRPPFHSTLHSAGPGERAMADCQEFSAVAENFEQSPE